jgi:nucleoside-diphosphate kinase
MGQDGLKLDQFAGGWRSFCHATDFWLVPWPVLAVLRRHRFQLKNSAWLWAMPSKTKGCIMAIERTFSIIKPDATRRNLTGQINACLEAAGLRIVAQKRKHLTQGEAEAFYAVHSERPFYKDLVAFMTSGPVVVQVLEGENAVLANREVMGATNPADAADGTIRKDFAESIEANSVHGSDSPENAATEIAYFFAGCEITS